MWKEKRVMSDWQAAGNWGLQSNNPQETESYHVSLEVDLIWTELCSLKIHMLKPQSPKRWDLWEVINQVSVQFSSVSQWCPTLCDPMNRSTPGLPVHHQLPEFTQTQVHRVRDANPAISSSVVPFFSCPQALPASESFPTSQLFAWGGQSTGVSALASFLPKKSQDWSPSERTGWSLCSPRDSQESSPTPQFKSINSSALSFLHSPTLTSIHDHWKNHSLD